MIVPVKAIAFTEGRKISKRKINYEITKKDETERSATTRFRSGYYPEKGAFVEV